MELLSGQKKVSYWWTGCYLTALKRVKVAIYQHLRGDTETDELIV